ncbi:MAG TPA: hypothetical protein VHA30_01145 [Patescibacteria group bacterium]|nr:hypothetical protein [Patescibacteria group bacterium]
MNKISFHTKTFLALFGLAFLGTFLCVSLWSDLYYHRYDLFSDMSYSQYVHSMPGQSSHTDNSVPPPPPASVDLSAWKTYNDKQLGLSFKYNPDWKVKPAVQKDGYDVIEVDPGKQYYNFKIYVSDKDYYIMGGLPYVTEQIAGQPAMNVNNMLFGIKNGGTYYTFDVGLSTTLSPYFDALVHSVQFQG